MSINNALTIPVEQNNVIQFSVIKNENAKNDVKYAKDGSIKNTKCNKIAGKDSEVYAFKTKEEIDSMIEVYDKHIKEASNPTQKQIAFRNKLLFLIGINIGIRASDIRTLKWNFFFDNNDGKLEFKQFYTIQPIKQRKQKKFVPLFFNQTVRAAINDYIAKYPIENLDDYLFFSRKSDQPIACHAIWDIIKNTASEAGIKQNIGSHSLRKTFGFWRFHEAKDKSKVLVTLQQCFNHSNPLTTMRYIGLLNEEIEEMYYSVELGLDMI
jgi:integrase